MSSLSLRLLQDLLNFDDPLNIDAAEHHLRDKVRRIEGDSNLIFNSVLSSDTHLVQTVTLVIDMQMIHLLNLLIVSCVLIVSRVIFIS